MKPARREAQTSVPGLFCSPVYICNAGFRTTWSPLYSQCKCCWRKCSSRDIRSCWTASDVANRSQPGSVPASVQVHGSRIISWYSPRWLWWNGMSADAHFTPERLVTFLCPSYMQQWVSVVSVDCLHVNWMSMVHKCCIRAHFDRNLVAMLVNKIITPWHMLYNYC